MDSTTKTYEISGPDICNAVPLGSYNWTDDPYAPESGPRIVELIPSGDPDRVLMRITRDTADACEAEALGQMSDGVFENVKYTAWREIKENKIMDNEKTIELYQDNAGHNYLFALDADGRPVAGFCDDGDADLTWATLRNLFETDGADPVDPVDWECNFDDVPGAYQEIMDMIDARQGWARELDPNKFFVMRYYIVDQIVGGDCFDHVLPVVFGDVQTAIKKAAAEWDALSEYDKRRRSDYYLAEVGITPYDMPDDETLSVIKVFK